MPDPASPEAAECATIIDKVIEEQMRELGIARRPDAPRILREKIAELVELQISKALIRHLNEVAKRAMEEVHAGRSFGAGSKTDA